MPASTDIYTERDQFSKPFVVSIGLHVALFGGALLYATILGNLHGESWGGNGGGGAMSATLVSSIPLPNVNPESTNILANESKGISQSVPKVEEKPETKAIPIPARDAKKADRTHTIVPPKTQTKPVETATNVIPYGAGGPISGPYGTFSAGGAKGGFGFTGGGGDFGSKYSWYVDTVSRKVSEYWLKYEVDPNVRNPNRVYITFEIGRDGSPRHIQIEQSSNVPSLDQSAVRALQRIDTFGPLPPDYRGSSVNVEFWFDLNRR